MAKDRYSDFLEDHPDSHEENPRHGFDAEDDDGEEYEYEYEYVEEEEAVGDDGDESEETEAEDKELETDEESDKRTENESLEEGIAVAAVLPTLQWGMAPESPSASPPRGNAPSPPASSPTQPTPEPISPVMPAEEKSTSAENTPELPSPIPTKLPETLKIIRRGADEELMDDDEESPRPWREKASVFATTLTTALSRQFGKWVKILKRKKKGGMPEFNTATLQSLEKTVEESLGSTAARDWFGIAKKSGLVAGGLSVILFGVYAAQTFLSPEKRQQLAEQAQKELQQFEDKTKEFAASGRLDRLAVSAKETIDEAVDGVENRFGGTWSDGTKQGLTDGAAQVKDAIDSAEKKVETMFGTDALSGRRSELEPSPDAETFAAGSSANASPSIFGNPSASTAPSASNAGNGWTLPDIGKVSESLENGVRDVAAQGDQAITSALDQANSTAESFRSPVQNGMNTLTSPAPAMASSSAIPAASDSGSTLTLGNAASSVGGLIQSVGDGLHSGANTASQLTSDLNKITQAGSEISQQAKDLYAQGRDAFGGLPSGVQSSLGDTFDSAKTAVSNTYNAAQSSLAGAVHSGQSSLGNLADTTTAAVNNSAQNLGGAVSNAASALETSGRNQPLSISLPTGGLPPALSLSTQTPVAAPLSLTPQPIAGGGVSSLSLASPQETFTPPGRAAAPLLAGGQTSSVTFGDTGPAAALRSTQPNGSLSLQPSGESMSASSLTSVGIPPQTSLSQAPPAQPSWSPTPQTIGGASPNLTLSPPSTGNSGGFASSPTASTSAGNLGAATKIYRAKAGDNLLSIASIELGDSSRWPEIRRLNTDKDLSGSIPEGTTVYLPLK